MMSTFKQVEDNVKAGAEYVQSKVKEAMPKVSFNKNGYEIRTQVLDMAKALLSSNIHKNGWVGKSHRSVMKKLVRLFLK